MLLALAVSGPTFRCPNRHHVKIKFLKHCLRGLRFLAPPPPVATKRYMALQNFFFFLAECCCNFDSAFSFGA